MANVECFRADWGSPGDYAALIYNDANRTIRSVDINLVSTRAVRLLIWDTDQGGDGFDPSTALIDRTFQGPTSDSINVAGNRKVVQETDGGQPYWALPPNILYRIEGHTNG